MTFLHCDWAYLPDGWQRDVRIEIAPDGRIADVLPSVPPESDDHRMPGRLIIPGVGNLHSHAFQRAIAGNAEVKGEGEDSFWTWREAMYRFVAALMPDDVQAIAAFAYMEMLEAGFTAVGEFHYLHHRPDGGDYDDPAEMAHSIAAAADEAGIGLTLLPVLYAQGGVDRRPLSERQRRFGCDLERYARLHGAIRLPAGDSTLGTAAHSLRAVPPEWIVPLAEDFGRGPVHIHVAEQTAEVVDVQAGLKARPVDWLIRNAAIDARWCLIHATHMDRAEAEGLAATGAVAGLCPITEGNLGDGIFEGGLYVPAGGRYGIGSDSHIRIDLTEELRILEYSQRFRDRRRTVLRAGPGSVGAAMADAVMAGGAQALGRDAGAIRPGCQADLLALDAGAIAPFAPSPDFWLDQWIFVAGDAAVRDVWSAGRHMVRDGRHVAREEIRARFCAVMARLMQGADP